MQLNDLIEAGRQVGEFLVFLLFAFSSVYSLLRAASPQDALKRLGALDAKASAAPSLPTAPPSNDAQTLAILGSSVSGMQVLIDRLVRVEALCDQLQAEVSQLRLENAQLKAAQPVLNPN